MIIYHHQNIGIVSSINTPKLKDLSPLNLKIKVYSKSSNREKAKLRVIILNHLKKDHWPHYRQIKSLVRKIRKKIRNSRISGHLFHCRLRNNPLWPAILTLQIRQIINLLKSIYSIIWILWKIIAPRYLNQSSWVQDQCKESFTNNQKIITIKNREKTSLYRPQN